MAMMWIGIDGGGSTLRVVCVDDSLHEVASYEGGAVNPNSVGHNLATDRIQSGIQAVLTRVDSGAVSGVGIGVAGASADHSADWLRDVIAGVLPNATVAPSSDVEIALVGGRGRLDGVVLLAGTGSVAYGRHADGRRLRAGGWGYLLGDEGSGYWIGLQAARSVAHTDDGRLKLTTELPHLVMKATGITKPIDIIQWMYREAHPRDVAALTTLVFELAQAGDAGAVDIVERAAAELNALAGHVLISLDLTVDAIVYAGGLLMSDTILCQRVTQLLGLKAPPKPKYSSVVGAALLARITHTETTHAN